MCIYIYIYTGCGWDLELFVAGERCDIAFHIEYRTSVNSNYVTSQPSQFKHLSYTHHHRHTMVANRCSTFEFDDRCSILASLAWLQGHRCDEVAELWPWCLPWCSKCWQRYLASEVSPIRLSHGSGTSPMHWIHVSRCRCVLRTRQGTVCLRCCRRIRLTIVATRVLNQHRSLDARIGFTFAAFATAAHEAVMRHECATLVALYAHRKAAIDNRLISA